MLLPSHNFAVPMMFRGMMSLMQKHRLLTLGRYASGPRFGGKALPISNLTCPRLRSHSHSRRAQAIMHAPTLFYMCGILMSGGTPSESAEPALRATRRLSASERATPVTCTPPFWTPLHWCWTAAMSTICAPIPPPARTWLARSRPTSSGSRSPKRPLPGAQGLSRPACLRLQLQAWLCSCRRHMQLAFTLATNSLTAGSADEEYIIQISASMAHRAFSFLHSFTCWCLAHVRALVLKAQCNALSSQCNALSSH